MIKPAAPKRKGNFKISFFCSDGVTPIPGGEALARQVTSVGGFLFPPNADINNSLELLILDDEGSAAAKTLRALTTSPEAVKFVTRIEITNFNEDVVEAFEFLGCSVIYVEHCDLDVASLDPIVNAVLIKFNFISQSFWGSTP
jgi:hypothetical protein